MIIGTFLLPPGLPVVGWIVWFIAEKAPAKRKQIKWLIAIAVIWPILMYLALVATPITWVGGPD